MLKYYQQARVLKTQRYTAHQSSSIESMADSLAKQAIQLKNKRGKTLKKEKAKHNITPSQKLHIKQALQINSTKEEEPQVKFNLFRNIGIKQKLKEMQLWKGQDKIRKRLIKETIEMKKYETSVHQYLIKKIKQKIQKSQQQKLRNNQSLLEYEKGNKKGIIRYKTLSDENNTQRQAQAQQYINNISQNMNSGKANKRMLTKKQMKISTRQSSNLILPDQSLLAHIMKRQKEFQQKSLKIVVMNNRHSVYNKQSCEQTPMAATSQKWRISKRRSESRTKNLKVQSICNYKASEYVIAVKKSKKSTENLIRPWDSQSKEYQ